MKIYSIRHICTKQSSITTSNICKLNQRLMKRANLLSLIKEWRIQSWPIHVVWVQRTVKKIDTAKSQNLIYLNNIRDTTVHVCLLFECVVSYRVWMRPLPIVLFLWHRGRHFWYGLIQPSSSCKIPCYVFWQQLHHVKREPMKSFAFAREVFLNS